MNEDSEIHRLCHIERKVAVLEERGAATAMALVLAEKLAAADKKLILSLMFALLGWAVAIGIAFIKH